MTTPHPDSATAIAADYDTATDQCVALLSTGTHVEAATLYAGEMGKVAGLVVALHVRTAQAPTTVERAILRGATRIVERRRRAITSAWLERVQRDSGTTEPGKYIEARIELEAELRRVAGTAVPPSEEN